MCEMMRDECKAATVDDETKYRTKKKYNETMEAISNMRSVDLKSTNGLKFYCVLNNLNFFHILDNYSFDIMHDVMEGTAPLLLSSLFTYCISVKLLSEEKLRNLISSTDYGKLNSQNIPPPINMMKKSLGQNASTTKCLIQHLPIILRNYLNDDRLQKVWICVDSMLQIIQIIYSPVITKNDIRKLKDLISIHLKSIVEKLNVELIPKHHFMTHYPFAIEQIGPLVHLSTMKYESKHREFTRIVQKSNNFINVSKSLSNKYQRSAVFKKPYSDNICHSPVIKPFRCNSIEPSLIDILWPNNLIPEFVVNSVKINSNKYDNGLIIKSDCFFHEIKTILLTGNEYEFLCVQYNPIHYEKNLHCIELELVNPLCWTKFKHSELSYKKTHDKILFNDRIYLIADCLELAKFSEILNKS